MQNRILIILTCLLAVASPLAAQKNINQLPSATTLAGDENIPIWQTGATKKLFLSQLQNPSVSKIPNLSLWMEADTLNLTDGAAVSTVPDRSGQGNVLTQSTGAKQPIFSLSGMNGLPTIVFDGANDILTTGGSFLDSSYNSAFSIFLVLSKRSVTTGFVIPAGNGPQWFVNTPYPVWSFSAYNQSLGGGSPHSDIKEPTLLAYTFDGSTHTFRVNGIRGDVVSSTSPLAMSGAFTIGDLAAGGFAFDGSVSAVIIFKRGLNLAETHSVEDYLSQKYLARRKQLVFIGDSLTAGLRATATSGGLPLRTVPALGGSRIWHIENVGVSGKSIANINTDLSETVRFSYRSGVENVATVWAGTNDMFGAAGQTTNTYNAQVAACGKLRALGFKVVIATLLPRGVDSQYETDRQTNRSAILSTWQTFADGLADVGGDPLIGVAGAQNNTTYYDADKTHLSDGGYTVAAPIFANAIKQALKLPRLVSFTLVSGTKTVPDASITANSSVTATLKPGGASGTRAGVPDCVPTAGVGFVATGGGSDNSTYWATINEAQ